MLLLTGKTLGERQKQLNKKVNEDAKIKIDFDKVKQSKEKSDVDKFYKIDLAVEYRNVEYILDILKCGDQLYISRALDKCTWICDDEFKDFVNYEYLSNNVLPLMSLKMRNKMLTTIATHIHDEDRIIHFHTYCMKIKLHKIALKFFIHTPEQYKLEMISKEAKVLTIISNNEAGYLKYFIGHSLPLAECYIKHLEYDSQKRNALFVLRYLYSVSNEKYLDLLETSGVVVEEFGRRLSKHIIQKNKARVMKIPLFYTKILNKDIISRNITTNDAKIFAVALLPKESSQFFHSNYYASNKFVLKHIPPEEKFSFIKKIFDEKYPGKAFETCIEFYTYDFYDMMTVREREDWALNNIANQDEILGSGKDYLWYKFVGFEKALKAIKKYVMKTPDPNERCEMLKVLIDSAENEDDLTKLLNYYCERHINEVTQAKERFLDTFIKEHKVWQFGDECWVPLEKIFYSLNIFDRSQYQRSCDYTALTLMYYVLNKKEVPDILNEYLDKDVIGIYTLRRYDRKLKSEAELMFLYILNFYKEKIDLLSKNSYNDDIKIKIRYYLQNSLKLAQYYEKTKHDLPAIMQTYIKLDWPELKDYKILADNDNFTSKDIMHCLKKDAESVLTKFLKIKLYYESDGGNINRLLEKLRTYFSHDLSAKFLVLLNECLNNENVGHITASVSVRGIFVLAENVTKVEFLEKHAPKDKKIDHAKISSNTLHIQKAICKQMHCSRPPLPLSNVMEYIVGDYVQYCLTLFRSYLLNLPYPRCLEFIESMMDKPISVQKHALRLAFECFDHEKLKSLVLDSWNKTRNVSLRMVIYKSLNTRMLIENQDSQLTLFEVYLTLTKDLDENDDESLFKLPINKLPDHLVGRYLETAWNVLTQFPEKSKKFEHMVKLLKHIECCSFKILSEDFLIRIIDEHIVAMLDDKQILNTQPKAEFAELTREKWELATNYLIYVPNETKAKRSLGVIKRIINKCYKMWNVCDQSGNEYIIRHFFKNFIKDLVSKSYNHDVTTYPYLMNILNSMEQDLKEALPEKDIYILIWIIRLDMESKKTVLKAEVDLQASVDNEYLSNIRKIGILLGSALGKLIKTYVEEDKFYWMFYDQIKGIVSNMASNFYDCSNKYDKLNLNDVNVLFCLGLLEYEIPETMMFALKMLPLHYKDNAYMDDYVNIIKKLQSYPNKELQYYLYEKLVNTDFKLRKYYMDQ